jgi:hypothetical protein
MHDKNGKLLKVDDKVTITCVIKSIRATSDYCNCNVETVEKMPPENKYTSSYTLNTKMVEKVED